MIRRRPDLLALIVALVGTLVVAAVFISDLMLSRERELAQGERRVQHFGIMLGEHTARTFEAVDILLREIATDLSENHADWRDWDSKRGWEYLAQRHSRTLPQLRDLILFDNTGQQHFISTSFPSPTSPAPPPSTDPPIAESECGRLPETTTRHSLFSMKNHNSPRMPFPPVFSPPHSPPSPFPTASGDAREKHPEGRASDFSL